MDEFELEEGPVSGEDLIGEIANLYPETQEFFDEPRHALPGLCGCRFGDARRGLPCARSQHLQGEARIKSHPSRRIPLDRAASFV